MGSLMAGWDSRTKDPKYETLLRNKSLTKEGIEDYWKLRKKTEEDHLRSISPVTSQRVTSIKSEVFGNIKEHRRTNSLPMIDIKRGQLKQIKEEATDDDLDDLMKNNCWWTRSNWAFLNEPPVIDGEVPRNKYASQHHVARLASTNTDTRISSN